MVGPTYSFAKGREGCTQVVGTSYSLSEEGEDVPLVHRLSGYLT